MIDSPLPIGYGPREAARAKDSIRDQKRRKRWDRIVSTSSKVAIVALGSALLGHVYVDEAYVFPLIRPVPVFIERHPDGALTWAVTTDQMPPGERDQTIISTLIQYAQLREGFSFMSYQYGREVVSGMTAPGKVRDDYLAWVDPKNPNSYVNLLGRDGTVRIEVVDRTLEPEKGGQGYMRLIYYRIVQQGSAERRDMLSVRIGYTDRFVVSQTKRDKGNPLSLIVTSYSNPIQMESPKS